MLRIRLCALIAFATLLLPAALARASAYTKVLQTYEQTGTIPPCQYSSAQLSSALKGVDTYGAQYFADFTNAIQSALTGRAAGQCVAGGPQRLAPATNQPAKSPSVPVSVTAATHADLPLPIALMALIGIVIVLSAAAVGLTRARGWEPAWAASWRHTWGEAGYRAGGIWSEFRDWLHSR